MSRIIEVIPEKLTAQKLLEQGRRVINDLLELFKSRGLKIHPEITSCEAKDDIEEWPKSKLGNGIEYICERVIENKKDRSYIDVIIHPSKSFNFLKDLEERNPDTTFNFEMIFESFQEFPHRILAVKQTLSFTNHTVPPMVCRPLMLDGNDQNRAQEQAEFKIYYRALKLLEKIIAQERALLTHATLQETLNLRSWTKSLIEKMEKGDFLPPKKDKVKS